jgi:hypothetical protein
MSALPPNADIGCLLDYLISDLFRDAAMDYHSGVRTRHLPEHPSIGLFRRTPMLAFS